MSNIAHRQKHTQRTSRREILQAIKQRQSHTKTKHIWEKYYSQGWSGTHLYGICFAFWSSASITSPRALKLLLICCVSFICTPVTPLLLAFSEPAKSIKWSFALVVVPFTIVHTSMIKMECDLLETSFRFVLAVARLVDPFLNTVSTSINDTTRTCFIPGTCTVPSAAWRISNTSSPMQTRKMDKIAS